MRKRNQKMSEIVTGHVQIFVRLMITSVQIDVQEQLKSDSR